MKMAASRLIPGKMPVLSLAVALVLALIVLCAALSEPSRGARQS